MQPIWEVLIQIFSLARRLYPTHIGRMWEKAPSEKILTRARPEALIFFTCSRYEIYSSPEPTLSAHAIVGGGKGSYRRDHRLAESIRPVRFDGEAHMCVFVILCANISNQMFSISLAAEASSLYQRDPKDCSVVSLHLWGSSDRHTIFMIGRVERLKGGFSVPFIRFIWSFWKRSVKSRF